MFDANSIWTLVILFAFALAIVVSLSFWYLGDTKYEKEKSKEKSLQKECRLNEFSRMAKIGEKSFYWSFGSMAAFILIVVLVNR